MAVRDLEPGELVMEDNPVGLSPLQVIVMEFIWWKMFMKMNAMNLEMILKQGELVMEDNPVGLSPLKVKIGKIGKSQNLCIFIMATYMENNSLGLSPLQVKIGRVPERKIPKLSSVRSCQSSNIHLLKNV